MLPRTRPLGGLFISLFLTRLNRHQHRSISVHHTKVHTGTHAGGNTRMYTRARMRVVNLNPKPIHQHRSASIHHTKVHTGTCGCIAADREAHAPGTTGASTALSRQSMHTAPLQRAVFLQMLHLFTSIPALPLPSGVFPTPLLSATHRVGWIICRHEPCTALKCVVNLELLGVRKGRVCVAVCAYAAPPRRQQEDIGHSRRRPAMLVSVATDTNKAQASDPALSSTLLFCPRCARASAAPCRIQGSSSLLHRTATEVTEPALAAY